MNDRIEATLTLPAGAVTVAAPLPELVSQNTSEAILGIPKRNYLDALPMFEASGGAVARLGRLRLVDRAAFVRWLGAREGRRDDAPPDEATWAAEAGLRRVK